VGIDALDRGAAMVGRVAQKIDHRLLGFVIHSRPAGIVVQMTMYQFEAKKRDARMQAPSLLTVARLAGKVPA
jgi:hypothetical protein